MEFPAVPHPYYDYCKTFRERSDGAGVFLEIGVPFLAGSYDERMYEELRLRAQIFEILTGGDFSADHADGQDTTPLAQGREMGLSVLPPPSRMIDELKVKLQIWEPSESGELTNSTGSGS
jgi:hypothetical protein